MPWAINGQVSTDAIPGGIQITNAQYAEAIAGMSAGKIVSIDNGFAVIDPPPPDPDPAPDPDPEDPFQPALPVLSGVTQFTLTDGDISNIDISAGFSFAMVIEPGVAWAFFELPMTTMAYTWNVNSTEGNVRITDGRTLDYIELSMKDDTGAPLQAGTVALQIFKTN